MNASLFRTIKNSARGMDVLQEISGERARGNLGGKKVPSNEEESELHSA